MPSNTPSSPAAWKELVDVEERMRSIVDHLADAIISIEARGTIATFNKAASSTIKGISPASCAI